MTTQDMNTLLESIRKDPSSLKNGQLVDLLFAMHVRMEALEKEVTDLKTKNKKPARAA